MKRVGWFTRTAVTLTLAGLALPQIASAAAPVRQAPSIAAIPPVAPAPQAAAPAPSIADIALGAGGALHGQVLDAQGAPKANALVVVRLQERTVATAQTDQDGRFVIQPLAGGMYQISAGDGAGVYRLWAPRTAPPAAQSTALVVSGQQIMRGQAPSGGWRYWLTNPWVLAGLLGAAIAVPIAINNHDKISTS